MGLRIAAVAVDRNSPFRRSRLRSPHIPQSPFFVPKSGLKVGRAILTLDRSTLAAKGGVIRGRREPTSTDHPGTAWGHHKRRSVGTYLGNREYFRIAPWLPGIGTKCQRPSLGLMIEEVQSCARENLWCSPALSLGMCCKD